jgi:hypothetical protein
MSTCIAGIEGSDVEDGTENDQGLAAGVKDVGGEGVVVIRGG